MRPAYAETGISTRPNTRYDGTTAALITSNRGRPGRSLITKVDHAATTGMADNVHTTPCTTVTLSTAQTIRAAVAARVVPR
jgi:hypothetical protein